MSQNIWIPNYLYLFVIATLIIRWYEHLALSVFSIRAVDKLTKDPYLSAKQKYQQNDRDNKCYPQPFTHPLVPSYRISLYNKLCSVLLSPLGFHKRQQEKDQRSCWWSLLDFSVQHRGWVLTQVYLWQFLLTSVPHNCMDFFQCRRFSWYNDIPWLGNCLSIANIGWINHITVWWRNSLLKKTHVSSSRKKNFF
jgi:hypothetical protein